MTEGALVAKILADIRSSARCARYVINPFGKHGYLYGYSRSGEIVGRRLDQQELNVLHRLLSEGQCKLGDQVKFDAVEQFDHATNPDIELPYENNLHIAGSRIDPV